VSVALQLVRIEGELPAELDVLRRAADAEGHGHMARLQDEFASGAQRFDRDREVLLAAFIEGRLVAVGGVTQEPGCSAALRMRRLYVLPDARRAGVASAIVNALTHEVAGRAQLLTVHAGNPGAARFWEAVGYQPIADRPWSHQQGLDYSAA
jgi:GNAT superfamily N-acetyltransferase